MKLHIKNIGKIEDEELLLDGLSVIAGPNNAGKSTISKALYASFTSLMDYKNQVKKDKVASSNRSVRRFIITHMPDDSETSPSAILRQINLDDLIEADESIEEKVDALRNVFDSTGLEIKEENDFNKLAENLQRNWLLENSIVLNRLATRIFHSEFDSQIKNLHHPDEEAYISLTISNQETKFVVDSDNRVIVQNPQDLQTEIVYVDDRDVVSDAPDFNRARFFQRNGIVQDHNQQLYDMFRKPASEEAASDEILVDDKLNAIYSELDKITDVNPEVSTFGSRFDEIVFSDKKGNEYYPKNLSEGLKTFIVLKQLLKNGSLVEGGTLVLDEPEIHLHPAWQVIFAKIIVLLQKNFEMHVLLTTHSPYFLRAVEVYAKVYNLESTTKYYLAALNKEGNAILNDVTNDTEKIYSQLVRPFVELEGLIDESEDENDEHGS